MTFGYWSKFFYVSLSAISIYLSVAHGEDELNNYRLVPKVLPIFLAIWQIGQSLKKSDLSAEIWPKVREVQLALALSALGDGFLVYGSVDEAFIAGIIAFGVAHLVYIKTFGWNNINFKTLGFILFIYSLIQTFIISAITNVLIFRAATIYALVIACMVWRSLDYSLDKNNSKLERLSAVFGGVSFMISDSLLVICGFVTEVPYSPVLVLSTYYYAQYFMSIRIIAHIDHQLKNK